MKKIYNLLVLALLMIAGTMGSRAQEYYVPDPSSGENVTEIEEGVKYAIKSASYASSYLCGDKISSSITSGCVYSFEKAGTNANGEQLWRIKRNQDNTYITGNGDNISYTNMRDQAFICQIGKARKFEYEPSNGDSQWEEWSQDKFRTISDGGENAWILLEEKDGDPRYLALWSTDNAAHIWKYTDTNALRVVKVKNTEGIQLVQQCMNELCPNGFGGYVTGEGLGTYDQAALDEAMDAYAACQELVDNNSENAAACATAAQRLTAAMEALNSSLETITPGYYYILNLNKVGDNGRAMPYHVEGNDFVFWDYKGSTIPEKVNGQLIPYVWHFTQNGDAWNIQNVASGKYIGEEQNYSWRLPASDTPVAYLINVVNGMFDQNGQPVTGFFNIVNAANTNMAIHAQTNGQSLVYWHPATATGNLASAWTFVKVNESEIEAALDEYRQEKLQEDVYALIEESNAAYNGSKSYLSDAVPYDDFTEVSGIVTFKQTDPDDPATANVTSNATETAEGPQSSIAGLFDGDMTTYFHSLWTSAPEPNGYHYLQIDLGAEYKSLVMKYARRHNTTTPGSPTVVTIQSADKVEGPYTDEVTLNITYPIPVTIPANEYNNEPQVLTSWGGMAGFEMADPHRFIRIVVKETEGMGGDYGYPFFYWSELRLYEGKGLDGANSQLTFINNKDAQVTQTLLNAVSKAEEALANSTVSQTLLNELQAAYDGFQSVATTVQQQYGNQVANTRLTSELDDVRAKLNEAIATVESECKDVATLFTETQQGIQNDIDAIAADVNKQYAATQLSEENTINTADIKTAIEKLLTDAAMAQKEFVNRTAKTRLMAEIEALQVKLDNARMTVEADCKDVAEQFTETVQGIQEMLHAAIDSVNTQYEAKTLTAESTLKAADKINAAIEKLLADAAAAQKAFINDKANTRLTEEIAATQAILDEAKAKVETDCKNVAEQFTETVKGIQDRIDAIADSVKTQNEAINLTEESTINTADVTAAIEKLLADAAAAQEAFESSANEVAYKQLMAELTALQTKLDDAKDKVAADCKDVTADFADTEKAIQDRITAIADSVKTQHEAIALTAESTIPAADVEAAIEKLLTDAAAAQRAYEIAANDAAYNRLTKELAELQDLLYAVECQVDEECKDVAADFVEAELAIQDKLNALKAELNEQHKAVELTEESTLSTDEIKAEIEKILADAIKAQEAYGPVTGIDGIENLADQNVKIFTVSGKQVNAVVKGQVNILVYPDGTVKRVYVK